MRYYCDVKRHLVCIPYNIENLHKMAEDLGIDRCWYHSKAKFKHYDIPKGRIAEITAKCNLVNKREIVRIAKAGV